MEMCKVTDSANILSWTQQYLRKMGQSSALSASQENCSWKQWIGGRISKALLFTCFKIALLHQPGMGHPQALWDSCGGCERAEGQERTWSRLGPTSLPPHLLCSAVSIKRGVSRYREIKPHTLIHNFSVILSKLLGSRSFMGLLLQSLKLLLRIILLNKCIFVALSSPLKYLCSSCPSEK